MKNIKRVKSSEIEFKDRLVSIQRVTKVTKGGRNFGFTAIVVVGNEDGIVGYGLGKAKVVTTAIAKGVEAAKTGNFKTIGVGDESVLSNADAVISNFQDFAFSDLINLLN